MAIRSRSVYDEVGRTASGRIALNLVVFVWGCVLAPLIAFVVLPDAGWDPHASIATRFALDFVLVPAGLGFAGAYLVTQRRWLSLLAAVLAAAASSAVMVMLIWALNTSAP